MLARQVSGNSEIQYLRHCASASDKEGYVNRFTAQTGSGYHIDLTLPLPSHRIMVL